MENSCSLSQIHQTRWNSPKPSLSPKSPLGVVPPPPQNPSGSAPSARFRADLEFAGRYLARLGSSHIPIAIGFCKMFPFFGQFLDWKDSGNRTHRNTSAAVDTIVRIDIELCCS